MKTQQYSFLVGLTIALSMAFWGCEKQSAEETFRPEKESTLYQYVDQNGDIKSFEIEGSTLTYTDQDGTEKVAELNTEANVEVRADVSRIFGRLQNNIRGTIKILYENGEGVVHWNLREDVAFRGDIYCVKKVRDQVIIGIEITSSNSGDPFAPGQRVVTTVRDLGPTRNPLRYDQIAKVMLIYARPDECENSFLPNVNDLIGYDNAFGNIIVE